MKKYNFKNYIAFTLTEMTMVVLIMSIIAAVSTPIVTNVIKNSVNGKVFGSIAWHNIETDYSDGGIYYPLNSKNSTLTMGLRPGNSASDYKNPALLVHTSSTDDLIRSPQIQFFRGDNCNLGNNCDNGSIGMSETNNIAILNRTTGFSAGSRVLSKGKNNVSVGYWVGQNASSSDDVSVGSNMIKYGSSVKSVFVGNNYYSEQNRKNQIAIGSYIFSFYNNSDSITIANYDGNKKKYLYGSVGTINIGTLAGTIPGFYNINIGSYASATSKEAPSSPTDKKGKDPTRYVRNINVGYYSAYNGFSFSTDNNNQVASDNINIGYYSGYNNKTSYSARNIAIGPYADFSTGLYYHSAWETDAINIGEQAGLGHYSNTGAGASVYPASIRIGEDAGSYARGGRNILIGHEAGMGIESTTEFDNLDGLKYAYGNIYIGEKAGYHSTAPFNIGIGTHAGSKSATYSSYATNNISIGYYAGFSDIYNYSNNTIAIGAYSCINVSGANKMCIGYGAGGNRVYGYNKRSYLSLTGWDSTSSDAQTFIGDVYYANNTETTPYHNYHHNSVTLYAKTVYAKESTMTSFSDRRLKENIEPSKHGLADIRKINIYNYNLKSDKHKTPKIGVIAQEYIKVLPRDVDKGKDGFYSVSANWMHYTTLNAIKELDKIVTELQQNFDKFIKNFIGLKSKIADLEHKVEVLKQQNADLKSRLNKINAQLDSVSK